MKKKIKICILTSAHMSQDIRIFHKQCKSLAKAGYQVVEIAQNEKEEIVEGIRIIPLPKPKNRFERMTINVWKLYRLAINEKARVYHFHDPEIIPAAILLRLSGKIIIYDIHEDYPGSMLSKNWIPIFFRYPISLIIYALEWFFSHVFCSAIIAAEPKVAERFQSKKTVVVQNFPILKELITETIINYSSRSKNIVYVGVIERIRAIFEKIKAMEYVKNKECNLVIAGLFENKALENECKKLKGWAKIDYRGWVNRTEIISLLNKSRIGIVLLYPVKNYIDAYPIKLFEYMAAGIPVIASDFPLLRKIVDGTQCGILVDGMNSKQIATAIDWLLDHPKEAEQMGKNGRQAVLEKYNWKNEEKKLLNLYGRLLH